MERRRTPRAAFVRQTPSDAGACIGGLRSRARSPAALASDGRPPPLHPGEKVMQAATRRRFLDDYIRIRHAEGRGSQDAEYYLALPFRDVTGRLQDQWTIRAKSFRYLEKRVLPVIEKQH